MTMMRHPLSRMQRGVAMLEFALLLPLLLLVLFGITEFSRALFQYDTLAKTTRDACRYLSTQAPGDPAAKAIALCLAVYGNTGCSGPALAPGLAPAMVEICDSVDASQCPGDPPYTLTGGINLVAVKIQGYIFQSGVGFTAFGLNFGLPSFTFGTISTVMRQS